MGARVRITARPDINRDIYARVFVFARKAFERQHDGVDILEQMDVAVSADQQR